MAAARLGCVPAAAGAAGTCATSSARRAAAPAAGRTTRSRPNDGTMRAAIFAGRRILASPPSQSRSRCRPACSSSVSARPAAASSAHKVRRTARGPCPTSALLRFIRSIGSTARLRSNRGLRHPGLTNQAALSSTRATTLPRNCSPLARSKRRPIPAPHPATESNLKTKLSP